MLGEMSNHIASSWVACNSRNIRCC